VINHATHYTPPILPRSQQADSQRTMLHPHMVMADSIHGIYKKRRGGGGWGGGTMKLLNKKPQKKFQPGVPKLSTPPICYKFQSLSTIVSANLGIPKGLRPGHCIDGPFTCRAFSKRPLPPIQKLLRTNFCAPLSFIIRTPKCPERAKPLYELQRATHKLYTWSSAVPTSIMNTHYISLYCD